MEVQLQILKFSENGGNEELQTRDLKFLVSEKDEPRLFIDRDEFDEYGGRSIRISPYATITFYGQ